LPGLEEGALVHTVAVVDDDPAARDRAAALVRADPWLRLLAAGPCTRPVPRGCAVVLLGLPRRPPPDQLAAVSAAAVAAPVVAVSSWAESPTVAEAVVAGALGALPREATPEAVAAALRTVGGGGFYLGDQLAERFTAELFRPAPRPASPLAPREIETLCWIASGYTQSQIATRMGLSQATVNTYAKRIRQKLNVNNKAALTRMAIEFGYVGPRGRRPAA
jgi:DNA-binding NarL/FixJ family response regulator